MHVLLFVLLIINCLVESFENRLFASLIALVVYVGGILVTTGIN